MCMSKKALQCRYVYKRLKSILFMCLPNKDVHSDHDANYISNFRNARNRRGLLFIFIRFTHGLIHSKMIIKGMNHSHYIKSHWQKITYAKSNSELFFNRFDILCWFICIRIKGIRFIVLYPPKCSHDLPPLAGLYTRKPFQSPEGYSRAVGST